MKLRALVPFVALAAAGAACSASPADESAREESALGVAGGRDGGGRCDANPTCMIRRWESSQLTPAVDELKALGCKNEMLYAFHAGKRHWGLLTCPASKEVEAWVRAVQAKGEKDDAVMSSTACDTCLKPLERGTAYVFVHARGQAGGSPSCNGVCLPPEFPDW